MLSSLVSANNLDKEWVDLILIALELGISAEEIKDFLNNSYRPS
ncbi:DNA-binding transcriptional MerR regulator [Metabacillus crassostreae]|nr:anti-repressor SinI family protein [Metabacillus crassostreae]MBM7602742.1 DNA-binding transcriptional MerR regulator [Metabacillus crassostreae]